MSQSPFQKFVSPKKNSKVKEEIRQEKKKAKKERAAYFDKVKEEKYQARVAARTQGFGTNDKKNPAATTPVAKKHVAPDKQSASGSEEVMPLNKYLAHCGICSRRDAVKLISDGTVKVNGIVGM